MADSESISTLLRVEELTYDLELLCRVVHDASQPYDPEWLALLFPRVHELSKAVAAHGQLARRSQC